MINKWIVGAGLLLASSFANAGIIDIITGADMAGIKVTAHFADNTQSTMTWGATSDTAGGVSSDEWSLTLDGETFGETDSDGNVIGAWVLTNKSNSSGIVGLTIDAGSAGILFDILAGHSGSTPGSDAGRPFAHNSKNSNDLSAVYSNLYSDPDLFGLLNIRFNLDTRDALGVGKSISFVTDTDKIPEPSTLLSLALGLLLISRFRKYS